MFDVRPTENLEDFQRAFLAKSLAERRAFVGQELLDVSLLQVGGGEELARDQVARLDLDRRDPQGCGQGVRHAPAAGVPGPEAGQRALRR